MPTFGQTAAQPRLLSGNACETAGLLAPFRRARSPSDTSTDGDAEAAPSEGEVALGTSRCGSRLAAGTAVLLLGLAAFSAASSMGGRMAPAGIPRLEQKQAVSAKWEVSPAAYAAYGYADSAASADADAGAYDTYSYAVSEQTTASDYSGASQAGGASTALAGGYGYGGEATPANGYADSEEVYGGDYGYDGQAAAASASGEMGQDAGAYSSNADSYGYGSQDQIVSDMTVGTGATEATIGSLDTSVKAAPEESLDAQKEFTGSGGPETVAGTKLVAPGLENLGSEEVYTHPPEPVPDKDYAEENPPMEFYMYRAQSDENYPMRNVNLGDLEGVMWYLHNEIVGFPEPDYKIRHFNISRIVRFKASVQNPPEWFRKQGTKFGFYQAYNAGKCSNNEAECDLYDTYGGLVGCQETAPEVAAYQMPDGRAPLWYSMPGPCPKHEYGAKPQECIEQSPGGDCGKGNSVTGAKDCSFVLEWAGEVRLDDFLPSTPDGYGSNFVTFLSSGGLEYDKGTDQGVGTSFWNGIHDAGACRARVDAVLSQFEEMYPRRPTSIGEPPECDSP